MKRGLKPSPEMPMKRRIEELEQEKQRLHKRLEWAKKIIEIQKRLRAPRPRVFERVEWRAQLMGAAQEQAESIGRQGPAMHWRCRAAATLVDESQNIASVRTMYRILAAEGEVCERRKQLRHPTYVSPKLLATSPNQVWSKEITKLLGPLKWTYFHLYVVINIFSRPIVGWMVAQRESTELAKWLLGESCRKHSAWSGLLTLHSARGNL